MDEEPYGAPFPLTSLREEVSCSEGAASRSGWLVVLPILAIYRKYYGMRFTCGSSV